MSRFAADPGGISSRTLVPGSGWPAAGSSCIGAAAIVSDAALCASRRTLASGGPPGSTGGTGPRRKERPRRRSGRSVLGRPRNAARSRSPVAARGAGHLGFPASTDTQRMSGAPARVDGATRIASPASFARQSVATFGTDLPVAQTRRHPRARGRAAPRLSYGYRRLGRRQTAIVADLTVVLGRGRAWAPPSSRWPRSATPLLSAGCQREARWRSTRRTLPAR